MLFTRFTRKGSFSLINFNKQISRRPIAAYATVTKPLTMGDTSKNGLDLSVILEHLESFAPSNTAENWDNTGLLIDPMVSTSIRKILLTNDLTEEVMNEALDVKAGMIISYHPPIFKALKTITARTWKERIVVQCLKNSIALYSPHTAWDNKSENGPNSWLAECLDPISNNSILETGTGQLCKLKQSMSVETAIAKIKQHIQMPHLRLALAVGKNLESHIESVAICVGAGTSVLAGVKADLYITGEMLHHDVLEAVHNGSHVILCNHSDSERGYLRYIAPILQKDLFKNNIDVIMSAKDTDPLKTV